MIRNEIQLDNVKFWVVQDIIYCKFNDDIDRDYQKIDIEEIFYNSISILSNGKYMPILIDLEKVSYSNSIKIFNFLAHSQIVRGLILSQVFLVPSIGLQAILILYNLNKKPYFLNKICNSLDNAIKHCKKENMVFNAISQ